jgi:glutamine cyclotransferase
LTVFIVIAGIFSLTMVLIVLFAFHRFGLRNLVRRQSKDLVGQAEWVDMGPTPLGEKGYTPQGMAWVKGKIIFANTWKDSRSRVYEIDPKTMALQRHFDMPEEAVHTSGLTWDGEDLWGVDYGSNRCYRIRLEASLDAGVAEVVGSFDSTLKGTSACCMVTMDGRRYLAVSDFMRTRRTIFVRVADALKAGTAEGAIDFEYRNEGFSQGLEFAEGFLYESENKLGINVINRMDLSRLRETRDARKATVRQFPAPSKGVEDLAWDGEAMWTSDETVFRFFKGTLE